MRGETRRGGEGDQEREREKRTERKEGKKSTSLTKTFESGGKHERSSPAGEQPATAAHHDAGVRAASQPLRATSAG